MKNKILIIAGDPNSINSEIIVKSWLKLSNYLRKRFYLICNYDLFEKQLKILNFSVKLKRVNSQIKKTDSKFLKIIDVPLNFDNPFKVNNKISSIYVLRSLDLAHKIISKYKDFTGLINCPISKNLLGNKGYGVTEILAIKCKKKVNSVVMLINNKKLSVSPLTLHTDLKLISKKINHKLIVNKVKTLSLNYKKIFKKKPKIAVLGLNPHNAELRSNSEEKKIIIPALKKLKKLKMNIEGPFASDSFFINHHKKFDVVLGMYHDQVLSPFKAIFKFDGINLTLGLNYLRLSPDHGVAKNIIKKNKANPSSLLECIKFLKDYKK